jgi:membrane protein
MSTPPDYTRSPGLVSTGRRCIRVAREKEIVLHAAALSYYSILSIVPLLTLLVVVTTTFHGAFVETLVIDFAQAYLLPAGEAELLEVLKQVSLTGHQTAIGVVLSVWGALRLFTSLDRSFAMLFESESMSLRRRVSRGLLTLCAVGLAVAAVAVLVGTIGFIRHPDGHLGPTILLVALVVVFFPIYYILPHADFAPRDVLPGATFAAITWTALSTGFAFYVHILGESVVGVVGSFLLLLTWFYFAGLTILLGGVLNAVMLGEV